VRHAEGEDAGAGQPDVARVEAFSDGVIAIIVTIMVLELHAPVARGMQPLVALWPVFLAYVLSYTYVAIYWVNHHRLFSHATRVTNDLVWSNMLLLFALSLMPFSTSYLGEHAFSHDATLLYLICTLLPSLAYTWLQLVIRRTGKQGPAADRYFRQTGRKGFTATAIYLLGLPLSYLSPWFGIACAAIVAVLWFLPMSPFDRLFAKG